MTATVKIVAVCLTLALVCAPVGAQAPPVADDSAAADAPSVPAEDAATDEPSADDPAVAGSKTADVRERIDDVAAQVDQDPKAREVTAGILKPIYTLAETFSFPTFHWIAFSIMVAGVVSFALQLVLGKLAVLARMSISISEILSDGLGLAVSLVGLVLTTQAAAENSSFTASSFSVLSATAVGALAGFIFYLWGQRQELQAVEGRRAAARDRRPPTAPPRA